MRAILKTATILRDSLVARIFINLRCSLHSNILSPHPKGVLHASPSAYLLLPSSKIVLSLEEKCQNTSSSGSVYTNYSRFLLPGVTLSFLYTLPYLGLPHQCSLAFSMNILATFLFCPFIYRNTLSFFPSIFIFLMSNCTFSEHSHPSSWDSVSFLLLVTIIITFNYLKDTAHTCFPNFPSSPPPKSIAIWLPFPWSNKIILTDITRDPNSKPNWTISKLL